MSLLGSKPYVANDAFVAPSSTVVGTVFLVDQSSVWYNAVIKGDCSDVRLGLKTAVLDRAVVNTVPTLETGFPAECHIGNWTVIGANAVVTSSRIGDFCSIGEGSVVPEGCIIEDGVTLDPGTVLTKGSYLKSDTRWSGNPATLSGSGDERQHNKDQAEQIALLAEDHIEEFLPYGNAYKHLEETVEEGDVIEEGKK
jgi:gamma-carbonic anhydrase